MMDDDEKSPVEPTPDNRPPFNESLRPFVEKATKRHFRRPPNPGIVVEPGEGQSWTYGPHHQDRDAWEVQLFDAFGTRSVSALRCFLDHLSALCMGDGNYGPKGWQPNETQINFAINFVSGVRPRNEMEAALAAQMCAVHFIQMELAAQVMRNPYGDGRTASAVGKLARTYAMQCDAMAKLKGRGGKQRITVKYERHNHNHQHVHAEIGGGVSDFVGRPQGPTDCVGRVSALEHEPCPALSGPDAARDALPEPCHKGARTLQNPRRRERVGRPDGKP